MNIQIYGKAKCFGTRSAERFFKERKIKYQLINTLEKGMSMRELESVLAAVGDIDLIIDTKSPLYSSLNVGLLRTLQAKKNVIVENPKIIKTPIIRDCTSKKVLVADGGKIEDFYKLIQG